MTNKTYKKYIPSKKFKKHLENREKIFDNFKEKKESKSFLNTWSQDNLPNPFDITKEFIQEKGLKI